MEDGRPGEEDHVMQVVVEDHRYRLVRVPILHQQTEDRLVQGHHHRRSAVTLRSVRYMESVAVEQIHVMYDQHLHTLLDRVADHRHGTVSGQEEGAVRIVV